MPKQTPTDGFTSSQEVGQRVIDRPELPSGGISTDQEVTTEMVEGSMHLKRGRFGKFEVLSDEGKQIGGTDMHPSPMTYMAMGTGF